MELDEHDGQQASPHVRIAQRAAQLVANRMLWEVMEISLNHHGQEGGFLWGGHA